MEIRRSAYFPDTKALYDYSVANLTKLPPPPGDEDGAASKNDGIRARFFHYVDFGDVDHEPRKNVEPIKGTAKCFSFIAPAEAGRTKVMYMWEASCTCGDCQLGNVAGCKHEASIPQPEEVAIKTDVWNQDAQRRALRKLREAAELELQGKEVGDALLIYFTQHNKQRHDDLTWKSRWAPVELAEKLKISSTATLSRQNPKIAVYIPDEVSKESEFAFPLHELCDNEFEKCGKAKGCLKKHKFWVPIESIRASPASGLDFSSEPTYSADAEEVRQERAATIPSRTRSARNQRRVEETQRRGLPAKIFISPDLQQHMLETLKYWDNNVPPSQL